MVTKRLPLGIDELPRFKAWRAPRGEMFDSWDYAASEGGATMAIAMASLFWPTFVDVDGCVLLDRTSGSSSFQGWREKLKDDRDVEAMLNHVHLWDLFDPDGEGVPNETMDELANIIAKCWLAALKDQFPERTFDVAVTGEPDDYGPTITVSQRT
jgi:hypothetical protein